MAVPENSTVRWFHSDMPNAPQVGSAAGGIIAVFDACLIHGFDTRSINNLVVVDGVATATISAGHAYEKHAVIRIAGATPETLNGDWRIKSVPGGSTLTFDCPAIADVSATGTITCLRATPGWWEKTFSEPGKGVYRSLHPDATGMCLRIDDSYSGTTSSRIRGYESMTNIDTGTRPFPNFSQLADNEFTWRRTTTTTASQLPRAWTLVADEAFVWFFMDFRNITSSPAAMYQFGDIVPAALDGHHCVVTGHAAASPSDPGASTGQNDFGGSAAGCYFARPFDGSPTNPPSYGRVGSGLTSSPGSGEAFPAVATGGYLFHHPVAAFYGSRYRGRVPGIMQSLTAASGTIPTPTTQTQTTRVIVEPTAAFPRAVMLTSVTAGISSVSHVGIDIHGPWR